MSIDLVSDGSSDCEIVPSASASEDCDVKREYRPSQRIVQKYLLKQENQCINPVTLEAPSSYVVEEAASFRSVVTRGKTPSLAKENGQVGAKSIPSSSKGIKRKYESIRHMPKLRALLESRSEELEADVGQNLKSRVAYDGSKDVPMRTRMCGKKSGLACDLYFNLLKGVGVLDDVAAELQGASSLRNVDRCLWRSIIFNLKKNKQLLERVNERKVSWDELLSMSRESLATEHMQHERRSIQLESMTGSILKDNSSFPVDCEECGKEARGVMVLRSEGRFDNHHDAWNQMIVRGSCSHCGRTWVHGEE